jgi:hypothetical protein
MTTVTELIVVAWPDLPPLPPAGEPVLVRVTTSPLRAIARQQLRAVVQQILSTWDPAPDAPPVATSFSYCENSGWIALRRGGPVGVDATRLTPFAEMESVARLYLGPAAASVIAASCSPTRAFALAWTSLEARLKCQNRRITEWSDFPPPALFPSHCEFVHETADLIVTLAIG